MSNELRLKKIVEKSLIREEYIEISILIGFFLSVRIITVKSLNERAAMCYTTHYRLNFSKLLYILLVRIQKIMILKKVALYCFNIRRNLTIIKTEQNNLTLQPQINKLDE